MNLIITLDDRNGISFNNRRQSRDSVVNEKILELSKGSRLLMTEYSKKLFTDADVTVVSDFSSAEKGDFCFAENCEISLENCETLYIFRWNRHYPCDRYFEANPSENGFTLVETSEFVGSSHEKITLDIYKKAVQE